MSYTMPSTHQITAAFDAPQAQSLLLPGANSIRGSALMRQTGGGVVTCAGKLVYLVPATAYADERLTVLYSIQNGKGFSIHPSMLFAPDVPECTTLTRNTLCDAQGYFTFDGMADGTFYLLSKILWIAGSMEQGGTMIQRVSIKGGDATTVVLAP